MIRLPGWQFLYDTVISRMTHECTGRGDSDIMPCNSRTARVLNIPTSHCMAVDCADQIRLYFAPTLSARTKRQACGLSEPRTAVCKIRDEMLLLHAKRDITHINRASCLRQASHL